MKASITAETKLSIGRFLVSKKAPYFAPIMMLMTSRPSPGLGTIGVTSDGVILYDPEEIVRWSAMQMAGAIAHEICHLWSQHWKRVGRRDHKTFNKAADMTINPPIYAMGFDLPHGVYTPSVFGFPENLMAEEYYDLLMALPPEKRNKGSEGDSGVGNGSCGSCAAGGDDSTDSSKPGLRAGDGRKLGRTPAEIAHAAQQVGELIAEAATKQPGSVPGGWARQAAKQLAPPKVNWRRQLVVAVRRAIEYRPGALTHRYDQPNRRQAALGYGDGVPLLPRYVAPVPRVAVAIDTSLSMQTRELDRCSAELASILRSVGAAVDFIVCDASIHGVAKVKDISVAISMLKGGGGTSFIPIFDEVALMRPRPEVLVVLTDGFGPAPARPPPGLRTIWGLVGARVRQPVPWGTYINIDDGEEERAA